MVYDWEEKEAECYRLYVEEKRSMDEVMAYWAEKGFTPSKRGFQTQFKRWSFPGKQNPAYKNDALVARTRELWNQNYSQKDMVDTLQNEGFHINDRELTRLRLRLRLFLRESVPRPRVRLERKEDGSLKRKRVKPKSANVTPGKESVNALTNAALMEEGSSEESSEGENTQDDAEIYVEEAIQNLLPEDRRPAVASSDLTLLSEELTLQKQLRRQQLQIESDEKWRNRKRRRRTRGWAGLPADAPNEPPRFPSETTIDEAKAYLGLSNNMYRGIREQFSVICKAEGVVKKTIAGPERWARIVQQLIQEDAHLSNVFQQEPEVLANSDAIYRPKGQKALSLDVICMDVTKRLRVIDTWKPLADAKTVLGLNPEETRQVRYAFVEILTADHFTSKHEAGEQHWTELKQTWINGSPLLLRALAQGVADPEYAEKLRAIEALARDAVKRDLHKKKMSDRPSKGRQVHTGPGPGPAPPVLVPQAFKSRQRTTRSATTPSTSTEQMAQNSILALSSAADLQIDPSLLLAASDAAIVPIPMYQSTQAFQNQTSSTIAPHSHTFQRYTAQSPSISLPSHNFPKSSTTPAPPPTTQPLPIYFRLHPQSHTPFPSKTLWLSILSTPSYIALRSLANREHPGTNVLRMEGLLTYVLEGEEKEVPVEVGDDEELRAYLEHVVGKKASFVILLGMGEGSKGV